MRERFTVPISIAKLQKNVNLLRIICLRILDIVFSIVYNSLAEYNFERQ